jgi:hypothetical protein
VQIYHFRTEWPVSATAAQVWSCLVDIDGWATWGPAFRRVALRAPHRRAALGAVADVEVRGTLPFTLRFDIEVVELAADAVLAIRADGDVRGDGRWELVAGKAGTTAVFSWDVGLSNPVLDAFGRLPWSKRLLAWNHDVVMRGSYPGFKASVGPAAPPAGG